MNLAHTLGHSLDNLDGYRVVVTVRDGEILDRPELVKVFDGRTSYGRALQIADRVRNLPGLWAVVDNRYEDGCWSDERTIGQVWDLDGDRPINPKTDTRLARTTKPKRDLPAGTVGRVVSDGRSSGVALVEFKTPSGLRREALSSNEYELFDPKAAR